MNVDRDKLTGFAVGLEREAAVAGCFWIVGLPEDVPDLVGLPSAVSRDALFKCLGNLCPLPFNAKVNAINAVGAILRDALVILSTVSEPVTVS